MSSDAPKRPTNRSECRNGIRPCPWVSCRYHLAFDYSPIGTIISRNGAGSLTTRKAADVARRWIEKAAESVVSMEHSCALDVADEGEMAFKDIGALLGITDTRVDQIEKRALAKVRGEHGQQHSNSPGVGNNRRRNNGRVPRRR